MVDSIMNCNYPTWSSSSWIYTHLCYVIHHYNPGAGAGVPEEKVEEDQIEEDPEEAEQKKKDMRNAKACEKRAVQKHAQEAVQADEEYQLRSPQRKRRQQRRKSQRTLTISLMMMTMPKSLLHISWCILQLKAPSL